MYWDEKYKTRRVKAYEGSQTIYNNESRLDLEQLVDYMEEFTRSYLECKDSTPAIREALCFSKQYPAMMLHVAENDLFCGRADVFPLGMNAQYINNQWGFTMNVDWFDGKIRDQTLPENIRNRLAALKEFWTPRISSAQFAQEMDPVEKVYLVTGGRPDIPGRHPDAAGSGSRVAGVFLDYEKLLAKGLTGLLQECEEKKKEHPENDPDFYDGISISLKTICKTLEWYADHVNELAQAESDPYRKDDLAEMERICRKLTVSKPETFREAIQLVQIYTIMDGAREWGRMDDYLGPFFVRDLEAGRIDDEEAIRLLSSFWRLMIAKEQVSDDRVIIGGLGRKNPEEADRLAMLIMETSRRVKDIVPQLTLRMYEGMDPKLYEKALDCIGEGVTYPMLYQDENIIPGIMRVFGLSYEDALEWMPLGCGEFTVNHKIIASPNSSCQVSNVLWGTINGGYDPTGTFRFTPNDTTLNDYETFEDLWDAFERNVRYLVDIAAKNHSRGYQIINRDMTLNLHNILYDGCMDSGKGVISGGTVKCAGSNEIYGLVTCSDSLYALKKLVYDDGLISRETMLKALKANWQGYEVEHALCKNADKYGNDLDGVDAMMARVHELVSYATLECAGKYPFLDAYGMVNINNRENTIRGRYTGATPDGRYAGDSLSNGNNPSAGADKSGVTAFINSLLKARTDIHFGAVQNMKFSKETFNSMRDTVIRPVLSSYFERGGAQAMITVIGREDLENARKNPEKYTNLIVRVGGFSARYIELDDDIQLDILNRTLN